MRSRESSSTGWLSSPELPRRMIAAMCSIACKPCCLVSKIQLRISGSYASRHACALRSRHLLGGSVSLSCPGAVHDSCNRQHRLHVT